MFVSSLPLPVLALSLDGAKSFALDLYDHMQRDWWATAYWSGVWVCGFIATFLLIRMLFTHWGDRDVMKKTLGLSLIVHMLVGMLSTTVMFGPGSSGSDEPEDVIAIRRVVVNPPPEESTAPAGEEHAAASERRLPGKSPAWEQSPKFDSRQAARLDREAQEPPRDVEFPPDRKAAADSLSIPAPDLADRPERHDAPPQPDRQTAKLNRPADRTQPPIGEETADARPGAGALTGAPVRGARAPVGSSATGVARRARPETTDDMPISIEKERNIPEPALAIDPQPRVARGAETPEPPPVAR